MVYQTEQQRMRYLVEFRLPSDSGIQSSLKEREGFPEGSAEDEEDVEDGRTPQAEGEVMIHANRYGLKDFALFHAFVV